MHEMSIAQNILDIVRDEMARHQVEKLEAINVMVGKLSAIVPSSLSFCYQVLTEDTDLAHTVLNVRVEPIGYACFDCGHRFQSEEMVFTCPECGADTPMITSGRDMVIENIVVADDQ